MKLLGIVGVAKCSKCDGKGGPLDGECDGSGTVPVLLKGEELLELLEELLEKRRSQGGTDPCP